MKKKPFSVIYACLVYIFLYLPIAVVIAFSFNTSKMNVVFEGFTFDWYISMWSNTLLMDAFKNTLIVAVASTLISTILGTLCAVGLNRFEFKLKETISSALYIPIVIPELVFAIAMLILFSSMNITMNMVTLIISHVTFSMPFVVITVRSRLAGYDRSIEEAARDLGANELRTFFRVTLPMIMPGVLSGAMLALTLSLDDVVVSFFTAGVNSQTLPLRILSMVKKGISPDVNALSTLIILGSVILLVGSTLIQNKLEKREEM
ncbi:MAG: ABC transporter permease [Lachnospiraceae bacterium]|nr:ABC transporter permease [Lachnospiraceae bacterium]